MTPTERSELTRWIAENVMGCESCVKRGGTQHCKLIRDFATRFAVYDRKEGPIFLCGESYGDRAGSIFNPTELIADAWLCVEKMWELGWQYRILSSGPDRTVEVRFWKFDLPCFDATAETAPLAICLAIKSALEGGK